MDRQEVWEHAVAAIEREFTSGEFEDREFRVVHNASMRTITIIETWTSEAMTLLNATGGCYTLADDEERSLVVQVPLTRTV